MKTMDVRIVAQGREYQDVPVEQIKRAVAQGRISGEDLVRLPGTQAWTRIAQVPEMALILPQQAPQSATMSAPTQLAQPVARPQPAAPAPARPAAPARPGGDARWREPAPAPAGAGAAIAGAAADGDEFGIPAPAKAARRRRRRRLEESALDMTPMIDVTFQLLIFFTFTNQMANPSPIEVPKAVHGQGVLPDGKQALLVDDRGRYYFGESTKEENVAPSLDALVRAVGDNATSSEAPLDVIISAHKGARYVHLRELVERLEKVENIGVIRVGVEEKQ
jgi:biopolymer transport protein ExbD